MTALSRHVRLGVRQALHEQRSFWRSAEYALFTFALPLALLLLIGSTTATGYLPGTQVEGQMIFVPSIIAFGVIVAAYVNLGAKLATLRHDGVLKRIRTTPLPASAYLSGSLPYVWELVIGLALIAVILAFPDGLVGLARQLAFGIQPSGHRATPQLRPIEVAVDEGCGNEIAIEVKELGKHYPALGESVLAAFPGVLLGASY